MSTLRTEILEFIRQRCEGRQPPTFRDIQTHFKLSCVGNVQHHIKVLEQLGLVQPAPRKGKRRGIVATGINTSAPRNIPILGRIVAGVPSEAYENKVGEIAIADLARSKKYFGLIVSGQSMIDAGILDGDIAVIEQTVTAKSGQIVAALVDGESTLKTFIVKNGKAFLRPENPSMRPIPIEKHDVQIQGTLILLQRRYGN